MTTLELKKKLIDKINKTENNFLLEDAFRLLDLNSDAEIYKLSDDQKRAIEEGRNEFREGFFLDNDQANQEIDKWLRQ